jgi:hypothetical protein
VTSYDHQILIRFPEPPGPVLKALALLEIARRNDPDETAGTDLQDLPQPWNPTTCPDDLRTSVWEWCDDVVVWMNRQHAWLPHRTIPPCWLQHPHIACEVPVLACLRWAAHESTSCEALNDWHTHTLPLFHERTFDQLGARCSGDHVHWPAASRAYSNSSAEAILARKAMIQGDRDWSV